MIIYLLPAINGDCILIEYEIRHFILIDGGYVDTYEKHLLPRLKTIAKQGGCLDLIVVTHIDSDHISGIVKLLEEEESPIEFRSIWYNGFRHIQSVAKVTFEQETIVHGNICKRQVQGEKPVSAKQGCTLSALIERKGINWNGPFNGGPVMSPNKFQLGDTILHILSPSKKEIDNIELFWKKRLIKDGLLSKAHSEEYWDDAFEFSLSKEKPGFHFHEKKVSKSYNLLKLSEEPYEPDISATNGSSISLVLETEGKRVLLLGDSHAETVIASLKALYGERNAPYSFDAVKLSHHGSYNNNSPELFNLLSTSKWLVSTNGEKYGHPDMETLAHIITKGEGNKIYFNYNLPVCKELMKEEYHKQHSFEIITPEVEGINITI